MTFYDDAELAAIEIIRETCREMDTADYPTTRKIGERVTEFQAQHGSDGLVALLVALARFGSVCVSDRADRDGVTCEAWLDGWALHKLEQHQAEGDG